MGPKGRGGEWQALVRAAADDLGPGWTTTGSGTRAGLTWGRVGWVWEHVGVNLKSGTVHEPYASRTWLDGPFGVPVTATAPDLVDGPDDRTFRLDDPGAVAQLCRWAELARDKVFGRTLDEDLEELEWNFELWRTERWRALWTPLAGLRLMVGRDPLPVVDEAEATLSARSGSKQDAAAAYWPEFRARLTSSGRDGVLGWLDELRRATLKSEKVPEVIVDQVLGSPLPGA